MGQGGGLRAGLQTEHEIRLAIAIEIRRAERRRVTDLVAVRVVREKDVRASGQWRRRRGLQA